MRKIHESSDRALREIFLPLGRMAVFVAGAGALFSALMFVLALLCAGFGGGQAPP